MSAKQIMPAGEYYIGDPGYIIEPSKWTAFCHTILFSGEDGIQVWKGKPVFAAGTRYGDGSYYDETGLSYAVDSGTLACIPISVLSKSRLSRLTKTTHPLAYVHTFREPFQVSCIGGNFTFGHVTIITDGSDDEVDDGARFY